MPKGSRVLMADDDKMLIDMYKERLELAGYNVTICRNGEEALGKIREAKPDIVLLDIMMPKINGYEALASIKSDPATKDIPVIMLSALMRDFNREKAVEAGADDYLIKSEAMPADVITKIEQVLVKYGKGTVPAPGQVAPNIPAPSATPPTAAPATSTAPAAVTPPAPVAPAPSPIVPKVATDIPIAAPVATNHVNTPVATPEASVMHSEIAPKPEEDKILFEPATPVETAPIETKPEVAEKNEEEVPVVKLKPQVADQAKGDKPAVDHPPLPTMSWETEPDKELKAKEEKKDKTPASVASIVVLAILLTALINDIVIYFFFFANK